MRAPAHPQALSPRSPKERPQLKPPGAHLLDLNRLHDPWARRRSLTPAPARRSSSSTPALGRAAGTWPRHPPVGARPQHRWGGRVLRRLAAPGKKFPAGGLRRPSGSERLKGGEEDGAARAPPPWEGAGGGMGGGRRHEGGRAVGGHQGRRKKYRREREGRMKKNSWRTHHRRVILQPGGDVYVSPPVRNTTRQ